MTRTVMSAVALLIVYGNLAVVFQPRKLGLKDVPGLPRPFAIHDAFLMTGMFNSYVKQNWDFFIEGRVPRSRGESGPVRWRTLQLSDFFPRRRAITFTELYAPHHWDMSGRVAQRLAWKHMSVKIRARHNRLHPARPVDRIRFGTLGWPMDPRGYEAARVPGKERRQLWYTEGDELKKRDPATRRKQRRSKRSSAP